MYTTTNNRNSYILLEFRRAVKPSDQTILYQVFSVLLSSFSFSFSLLLLLLLLLLLYHHHYYYHTLLSRFVLKSFSYFMKTQNVWYYCGCCTLMLYLRLFYCPESFQRQYYITFSAIREQATSRVIIHNIIIILLCITVFK